MCYVCDSGCELFGKIIQFAIFFCVVVIFLFNVMEVLNMGEVLC